MPGELGLHAGEAATPAPSAEEIVRDSDKLSTRHGIRYD